MSVFNYTLRAELHTRKDKREHQSFLFERRYRVKYLGKRGYNATYFDPELKMRFENKPVLSFIYEIEINNDTFSLSDNTEKATDFIRRVNYIFDWMQLQVSLQGEIRLIENKDELKAGWVKIKKSLLADYRGKEVDKYLAEIDARFEKEEVLYDSVKQYFNFGLLFPPIPVHHPDDWQHKGLVEFSEYEGEKFEEEIHFIKEMDNLREYEVKLHSLEGSGIDLQQYAGRITIPRNEHLPLLAVIEVVFKKEDIANQWYFELKRN